MGKAMVTTRIEDGLKQVANEQERSIGYLMRKAVADLVAPQGAREAQES